MRVKVESYAGYRGEQRPLCFFLGGRRFDVQEVLDQWYGPDDLYFRVRAEDSHIYILRHHEQPPGEGEWTVESFRRLPTPVEKA